MVHLTTATLAFIIAGMALPSHCFYNTLMASQQYYGHDIKLQESITNMFQQTDNDVDIILDEEAELPIQKFATLRSIGVDYGLTRTGVAFTVGGYRPRPLTILSGLTNELTSSVVTYVISERANNIVLGLPLNKNGTESHQSYITRDFAQYLIQEVRQRCGPNIDLVLWDERYTSKEAASRIRAEAMARNERIPSQSDLNKELDADAACIILEDYYKELGLDAEVVMIEDEDIARQCNETYKLNMKKEEMLLRERIEERERGRNARREMMERDMALEREQAAKEGEISKKKKKKKKKKKR